MPNMGANGEDLDITAETIDGGAFLLMEIYRVVRRIL